MAREVVIVPGNGGGNVFSDGMWYGWLRKKLLEYDSELTVKLEDMPDPVVGRESIWIPFMRDKLKVGENSIIVGHSTGAVAAVRFCEQYKVHGIVLVGAYTTDCGMESEKLSGYFDRPWQWSKAKQNSEWISQFGSRDDQYLSWDEQVEVSVGLETDFHRFEDRGHFIEPYFPELVTLLKGQLMKK